MQTAHTKKMVELAGKKELGKFSKIAKSASEAGIIVPSILKKGLEEAGFKVEYKDRPDENANPAKNGSWCFVYDKDRNIVARAYSHDEADALLQAIYAEMKEEEKTWVERKLLEGTQKSTKSPQVAKT